MKFIVNESEVEICNLFKDSDVISFELNGKRFQFTAEQLAKRCGALDVTRKQGHFIIQGADIFVSLADKRRKSAGVEAGAMVSPMPGKIFKVLKVVGAEVKKGDTILIMEAMKMEHPVKASRDGIIKEIVFTEGQQVDGGVELVKLEEE